MRVEQVHVSKGKVTAKEASGTLAKAWPNRLALYVCNPSTKEVWLALGPEAAKEEGIWLRKEGGSAVIESYSGVVSLCTTAGEGTVTYSEV